MPGAFIRIDTISIYFKIQYIVFGPCQANLVLMAYASSEGSGEPAHPRSLARTSAAHSYKQWVKRKARSLAPLNGWAWAIKICHDGMLEDTNSLDTAHLRIKNSQGNARISSASVSSGRAPSSEFVSSSIPSWHILTAHAQPFRGARDLAFYLKVPLDSLLVWASCGGSGETARMRRLAWTFAARIGDKYQIRLTRSRHINCALIPHEFVFIFCLCLPLN